MPAAKCVPHSTRPHVDFQRMPTPQLSAPSLQIYRNFEFGKLMKLVMLDTRIIGEQSAPCPGAVPAAAE